MELPSSSSPSSSSSSTPSSDFAPFSSSSSNDLPTPKMAGTSNAAEWPSSLVREFIVILLENTSVRNGKMERGWAQAVTKAFNTKTGKDYSVNQIQEKLKRLKKQYKLFCELINITGMGSNPNTSSEAWIAATQSHKKYKEFSNKRLDHCGKMRQLFSSNVAQTKSTKQVSLAQIIIEANVAARSLL